MRSFYITFLLWLAAVLNAVGQNSRLDTLMVLLAKTTSDTSRVLLLEAIADYYKFLKSDSTKLYAQRALSLAERLNYAKGKGRALSTLSVTVREQTNMPQALDMLFKALTYNRITQDRDGEGVTQIRIGTIYADLGDKTLALDAYKKAVKLLLPITSRNLLNVINAINNMGNVYQDVNQLDSAALAYQRAYQLGKHLPSHYNARSVQNLGVLQARLGNKKQALNYYRQVLREGFTADNFRFQGITHYHLADLFKSSGQTDSSLHYALLARKNFQKAAFKRLEVTLYQLLTQLYQTRNKADSALYYQSIGMALKDSLYGPERFRRLQLLRLAEQQHQQKLVEDQKDYQTSIRLYSLLGGLVVFLLVALILYRNNRQKHQANLVLATTLTDLRTTQTQLIQREKMASLGELTAGIAHEIQNPLNFVNNFSEVSVELIEEQKEALAKGDTEEATFIANDLAQNLQRITQNGQRASNIVRGMLEHSRSSTGERLPTDLNALCDEYMRLAYQGMRAKDSDGSTGRFNCKLETHFAPGLPLVSVVAQDISRVLLNLFNNAFYAVSERGRYLQGLGDLTGMEAYQPTVCVSTALLNGHVEIRVHDNGTGIPESIKEKIFQPFFTTKPTGEGTGLGLSLSYDIVTKGHGGTLVVESVEEEETTFIIELPVKKIPS